MTRTFLLGATALSAAFGLSACGGGGSAPTPTTITPPVQINSAPTLSGALPAAVEGVSYSYTPVAVDADGDALNFTITGLPAWASFDAATGTISGTPGAGDADTEWMITLSVSDGEDSVDLSGTLRVEADAIEKALRTGDARDVIESGDIFKAIADEVIAGVAEADAIRSELFGLDANGETTNDTLSNVSWNPTHDAARLRARFGDAHIMLASNAVTRADEAVTGDAFLSVVSAPSRAVVMGGNPLRNAYRNPDSVSADMHTLMTRTIDWMTERAEGDALNVVLTQESQNQYFPDQRANRAWLDTYYEGLVTYNEAGSCDGDALDACLSDADLLVISSDFAEGQDADAIAARVEAAMGAGMPVLYMHVDGGETELSRALLPLLNVDYVGDNYWRRQTIKIVNPAQGYGQVPAPFDRVAEMVARVGGDDFTFSLANCDDKACPDDNGYAAEFLNPANIAQDLVQAADADGTLFADERQRLSKLLVVLGDVLRRDVAYPMDKVATPRAEFLRSLLADKLIANRRLFGEAQADMGNFSRSDFSAITPVSRTVEMMSKTSFRSTGAYALPGQTFTVTRTDENAVNTTIFINTVRDGSTHEFQDEGYKRPKHLRSTAYALAPGETVSLTSPLGGPIQVGFDAKDVDVSLSFRTVGEHPFWTGAGDDTAFASALEANQYDWAEVVTEGFEVHSKTDKMMSSLEDVKWGSASALGAATERYMSNYPHILAGYRGEGIEVVAEIHDWAAANGLEMETLERVKHMNADQATCGYGCSGNPYDAYWSYDPLGHGDLHELGHGLEKGRFKYEGWEGHMLTNPYSYYSKSRYGRETGASLDEMSCQSLPFQERFEAIQNTRNATDPFAAMSALELNDWQSGVIVTIQFMMGAQDAGIVEDGWHILARLHIVEREFAKAIRSDNAWIDARAALGFDGLSRDEAREMTSNDWMVMALAKVMGRDARPVLDMWAIPVSDLASDHVAAQRLPALEQVFYAANDDNYCEGLDKVALAVDGVTAWPQ